MHKLDRSKIPAPVCLTGFDYHTQTWNDFRGPCRKQVRLALQRIQGQQIATNNADDEAEQIAGLRCAYCEGPIFKGGHLEHFCRKNRRHPDGYPELTFAWDNLFLSCDSREHCGHFKDRPAAEPYDAHDLVKPDQDDPDAFFFFCSSGAVYVRDRAGMSDAHRYRASETIRVFNLDCPTLRGARCKALKRYSRGPSTPLDELMDWDPELRELYIREELENTSWDPYATTIRHFFEKLN